MILDIQKNCATKWVNGTTFWSSGFEFMVFATGNCVAENGVPAMVGV